MLNFYNYEPTNIKRTYFSPQHTISHIIKNQDKNDDTLEIYFHHTLCTIPSHASRHLSTSPTKFLLSAQGMSNHNKILTFPPLNHAILTLSQHENEPNDLIICNYVYENDIITVN